jgi:predicted kinase
MCDDLGMQQKNNNKPVAVFMMGGPGAGKGYIRKRQHSDLPVLDCDEIKKSHPEYDPKNPMAIHEWSRQQLARRVFQQLGAGESFVYDGTGSNADKYVHLIEQAQEAGFETVLHYVEAPLNVALDRNSKRERTVDEAIVREKHSTISASFKIVKLFADKVIKTKNC